VEDVNDAVSAATKAFETWAFSSKEERLRIFRSFIRLFIKKDGLTWLKQFHLEMGAPIDFSTQLTSRNRCKSYQILY
jgi:aldehyde dehydrogenase (NAD+)